MHFLYSWYKMNLLENIFETDFLIVDILLEDIFGVDDSDDHVDISFIYWIARISLMSDKLHNVISACLGINSYNIMHITHNLPHHPIVKVKDVLDQLMFGALDRSSLLRFCQEHPQLCFTMYLVVSIRIDPQPSHHHCRYLADQPRQWSKHNIQDTQR